MKSVKLALDVVAVLERGMMEMLFAAVAAQRLHVGHPEMVGEGTDLAHCLLEGVLDLEAQAVETNEYRWRQGEVSVHMRRQAPLVGWITATKRTSRPAGRHSGVADPILDGSPRPSTPVEPGLGLVGSRWRLATGELSLILLP